MGREVGYAGNNGTIDTDYKDSIANRTRAPVANPGAFRWGSTSAMAHAARAPTLDRLRNIRIWPRHRDSYNRRDRKGKIMTPSSEESNRDLLGRLGRYRQRLVAQGRLSAADALDRVVAELRAPPAGDGAAGRRP